MDFERVTTLVLAAAAVLIAYAVVWKILRGWIVSALVVLPLVLSLPWDKRFPAVGDALALFASMALLAAWLYARSGRRHAVRNACFIAATILIVKQDMLLVVLAAIAVETYFMRKTVRPSEAIGVMIAMVFVACLSIVIVRPIAPGDAVGGLFQNIIAGSAWDGTNWMFTGTDTRASIKSASTFGRTFYIPLLVPFAAIACRYRREWWLAPTAAWCALIFLATVLFARWPILRACPPMAGALLVLSGVSGIKLLREELPRLGANNRAEAARQHQANSPARV